MSFKYPKLSVLDFPKNVQDVKDNPTSIFWCRTPSEEMQFAAVENGGDEAISYITSPCRDVQMYCCEQDIKLYDLIKHPCKEVKVLKKLSEI